MSINLNVNAKLSAAKGVWDQVVEAIKNEATRFLSGGNIRKSVCWQRNCPAGLTDCDSYCSPTGTCLELASAAFKTCKVSRHRRQLESRIITNSTCAENPDSADCFCLNKPDGQYENPWAPGQGIICYYPSAFSITCPSGHTFIPGASPPCQPAELMLAPAEASGSAEVALGRNQDL
ncbi:hypothetical protein HYH03_000787 [Edaphochlamys debaryana]|uniref:Uncharacterized protein n=1 Tax=Edaphochlamys debaryana TaxID=47281 RepID=A0A836C5J3_9CHLO|nr:hypothetical protein HYH03_000787 [Edaphochlamys debaryana]|eukprot:KAG2500965.1 hypothetical protein HYH03_000787 [Edaphochlamys debaryana]